MPLYSVDVDKNSDSNGTRVESQEAKFGHGLKRFAHSKFNHENHEQIGDLQIDLMVMWLRLTQLIQVAAV